MRILIRPALAWAAFVLLASAVDAQAPATGKKSSRQIATACKITDKSAWVVRQAAWFAEAGHPWSDDSLRQTLIAAAQLPAELTLPAQYGFVFAGATAAGSNDSLIATLTKAATARGAKFPTKSTVGAAGMHAVFLLALRDTALARAALHRLMEAGPDESPAADVAVLEDRVRLASNRRQIYGTQFEVVSGRATLLPMEDSAHVDLRREDAGLPPFKTSVCVANQYR